MQKDNNIRGDEKGKSSLDETKVNWVSDLKRSRQAGPFHGTSKSWTEKSFSTIAVHAGTKDDMATGVVGTPIYQGSTFLLGEDQYKSFEEGHARDRFIYSRYGNPSQWAVQEKLAALEGAESALVFSSGMAAISSTILAMVDRGAHIVASDELYGGTYNFLNGELSSLGMSVSYASPRDFDAIEAAIKPETQILYFESSTNPLLKIVDIEKLVSIAKKYKLRLILDATFTTPLGYRALDLGVDVVVHSASKYLNGHSDLIAGAAIGSRKVIDMIWPRMLNFGGSLDPHACFLLERGLKTLALRMAAHEKAATALAIWLEKHPSVVNVFYPGLESHPDHKLAKSLLNNMGGMVTFEIKGGDEAALKLLNAVTLAKQATSLGGVETLISLPYNTSQSGYTSKMREKMGINSGCVRLSVGVEDPDDLIRDFEMAFSKIS